ncbi:hypothetical protein HL653_19890 [Sphingomonas sp. AP4-R1]|uniref:hypothetical protein n=1 Tax=Sphingomonas sp. AP4-R1 TaxID=2735134 RepID=UPI0014938F4B|nr:hypothetical protein [Sphingomonas sp. AP4-R1]QJU59713.1 hypothetical protein HL653_19890 [Sphingomonas sp. AP4-R1]
MPIDIDDNLVNAAIIEFHAAKDHGKTDPQAWAAAVSRVRHDVLTLASLTCERVAEGLARGSEDDAETARTCAAAIRALY